MGKKGISQMKSITCLVLLNSPTSSPSWGSTLPIHHPRAPFQSPKVTKNSFKLTRSCLAGLFIGKEGDNYLKSVTCSVFLICPTPCPSWGGTSPIHHLGGPFKSPKVTNKATNLIRPRIAELFMGKEGNCHFQSMTCSVFLISPTSSPSWDGTSPIHHPRAPFQSPKVTKSAVKITRSCLAGIFIKKEGDNYLKFITCSVFLICPTPSPS